MKLIPVAIPVRSIEPRRQEEILQVISCQRAPTCLSNVVLSQSILGIVADDCAAVQLQFKIRQGLILIFFICQQFRMLLPLTMYVYTRFVYFHSVFSEKKS